MVLVTLLFILSVCSMSYQIFNFKQRHCGIFHMEQFRHGNYKAYIFFTVFLNLVSMLLVSIGPERISCRVLAPPIFKRGVFFSFTVLTWVLLDTNILFEEKPSERAQQSLNLTEISVIHVFSLTLSWYYLPLAQNNTEHLFWIYSGMSPIISLLFFVKP